MAITLIILAILFIAFVCWISSHESSGNGNISHTADVNNAPSSISSKDTHHSAISNDTNKLRKIDVKRVMDISALGSDIYESAYDAFMSSKSYIIVDEDTYNKLNEDWHRYRDRELALAKTVELNNQGMVLEKASRIEEAIDMYEKCISIRYPATHAYERLMILYRKIGAYEQEQRIIGIAVEVFSEENKRRAERAKMQYPEYSEQIDLALETNENVSVHGKFILNQIDVLKYFDRNTKAQKLIDKRDSKK